MRHDEKPDAPGMCGYTRPLSDHPFHPRGSAIFATHCSPSGCPRCSLNSLFGCCAGITNDHTVSKGATRGSGVKARQSNLGRIRYDAKKSAAGTWNDPTAMTWDTLEGAGSFSGLVRQPRRTNSKNRLRSVILLFR